MKKKGVRYFLSFILIFSIVFMPFSFSHATAIQATPEIVKRINQGTPVTISVLQGVSGTSLAVEQIVNPPDFGTATIINNATQITYTPNKNAVALRDTIIYRIVDVDGDTSEGVITIYINPSTKIANNDSVGVIMDKPTDIDVLANDVNFPSGAEPVINFVSIPPKHGTADKTPDGGFIRYTPAAGYVGTDMFTYEITDNAGIGYAVAAVYVNVKKYNNAPDAFDFINEYTKSTNEDTALSIDVLTKCQDADRDILRITDVESGNNDYGTAIISNGKIVYTPTLNVSEVQDTISYTIRDPFGESDTGIVAIKILPVNDAPVPGTLSRSVTEHKVLTIDASDIIAAATDVENDPLAVTTPLTQGKYGYAVFTDDFSQIKYTPYANVTGTDTIKYALSDHHSVVTGTITINVSPTNDAPTAADDTAITKEDTPVTINVLANDTDPEKDKLSIVKITSQGTKGDAVIKSTSIVYTPKKNDFGTDTFKYQITDGPNLTEGAVTVAIASVNDPPVATTATVNTLESTPVTINPLSYVTDPDSDPAAWTITGLTSGKKGAYILNGNQIIYTPTKYYNGKDSCQYTVMDNDGGSATGTININVISVNDAPVALADSANTKEHTKVTIPVLANDTDPDSGDKLSISGIIKQGTLGTATIASGKIDYVPSGHAFGVDTFTYEVSDLAGSTSSAIATVTITAVPDAPTAVNDNITVTEGGKITFNPLDNDYDPKNKTFTLTGISKQPKSGTVSLNGTEMTYTPQTYTFGTDTIQYTLTNSDGLSSVGTVNILITAVNNAPVAADDTASTKEHVAAIIDVLKNDKDMEGDTPQLTQILEQGTLGTAVINSKTKNITYTPKNHNYGNDTFVYQIQDSQGATASAIVTVAITEVNDVPVTEIDKVTAYENFPVTIKVLKNDSDADGDTLKIDSATKPAKGTVTVSKDKDYLTYTPGLDLTGDDSFDYKVNDGRGGTTTGAVKITIKPYDVQPTDLKDLTINGTTIDGFNPTTTSYAIKMLSTFTYVDFNVETSDPDATFLGPTGVTDVQKGINKFKWVVTGQNGMKKEYNLSLKLTCPTDIVVDDKDKAQYPDTKGNWAEINAAGLGGLNIIAGYPDGTYQPNKNVSRAEFAKILLKVLQAEYISSNKRFKDVKKGDWYYDVVNTASAKGLIEGYKDGTFKPDATITREEMAAMIARAIKQINGHEPSLSDVAYINFFDSYTIGDWAKPSVGASIRYDILSGKNNNVFDPRSKVTRAEAAKVVDWLYGLEQGIVNPY